MVFLVNEGLYFDGQYKTSTAEYGLRTEYKTQAEVYTDCGIKHGAGYKTLTEVYKFKTRTIHYNKRFWQTIRGRSKHQKVNSNETLTYCLIQR